MSKCKTNKTSESEMDLILCESMNNYMNHDKSVFQKVMTVNMETNLVTHKIKCGKKGGYVYLGYCPFCGGVLQTIC